MKFKTVREMEQKHQQGLVKLAQDKQKAAAELQMYITELQLLQERRDAFALQMVHGLAQSGTTVNTAEGVKSIYDTAEALAVEAYRRRLQEAYDVHVHLGMQPDARFRYICGIAGVEVPDVERSESAPVLVDTGARDEANA